MLGNYGDDLTNFWGLMGLFGLFLGLAVTVAKGWVKFLFFGLAALSFFLAVFWQSVKVAAPNAAASIVEITNNPQSWFVVFILVVAILIFRPPKFGRASRLSEPSTSSEISVDLASLSAEFDAKNNQTWEFARTVFDGLKRLETQANAIEQKLNESVADRIGKIENTLRPQTVGLANSLFLVPEDSRFDQIVTDINAIHDGIILLHNEIESEAQQRRYMTSEISKAVKYKLILEVVTEFNETIVNLTEKLLNASPSDYADDAAWRLEYEKWRDAVSKTDNFCDLWVSDYRRYLDISQKDFENADAMPTEHCNLTAKENGSRYQTVEIISKRLARQQAGALSYLEAKAWALPG